jgi:hypothetical protein
MIPKLVRSFIGIRTPLLKPQQLPAKKLPAAPVPPPVTPSTPSN